MRDLDHLAPAIAEGDVLAFGDWASYAESSLRLSLRRFAAAVDVEAVVQETLLRIWQLAPKFVSDGRENGLLRLAYRISHNLAITEARRRQLVPLAGLEAQQAHAELGAENSPVDPLLRKRLSECHDKLPDRPKQALAARLESGGATPDRTLAAGLGMQPNTFLQNVTRARRQLLECLKAQGVDLAAELL